MIFCVPPPQPEEDDDTRGAASLALALGYRWPDATRLLRYKFLDGTEEQKERVRTVIDGPLFWSRYCGVQFEETDGWAEIRITFDAGGSWSHMGTGCAGLPQDTPSMQLGWITPTTSDVEVRRVVLHEFGHALGFAHEHQSPHAAIPWDKEAVYAYFQATNGWDKAMVDAQVFARLDAEYTLASAFDVRSIMAYLIPVELLTDPTFAIGGATVLSETDKAQAQAWYGPAPEPARWHDKWLPMVEGNHD